MTVTGTCSQTVGRTGSAPPSQTLGVVWYEPAVLVV